jgi:hypothetical protein
MKKLYFVGPKHEIEALFPKYAGRDERYSLDGSKVIYEVNIDESVVPSMLAGASEVVALSHEEVIVYLQENAEEWSGSVEKPNWDELNKKTKAELVALAGARGIESAGMTKVELIEELLA